MTIGYLWITSVLIGLYTVITLLISIAKSSLIVDISLKFKA
jgi:hypothetical protein